MPKFTRGEVPPDAKSNQNGTVVVKVFLQDPNKVAGMPKSGNYKKEFILLNVTVTEVAKEIEAALFGNE